MYLGKSAYLLLGQYRYKYEVLHTINSVLNTSVKVSGCAHHHLPGKKLSSYVRLIVLCYIMVRLGYVRFGSVRFGHIRSLYLIAQKLGVLP